MVVRRKIVCTALCVCVCVRACVRVRLAGCAHSHTAATQRSLSFVSGNFSIYVLCPDAHGHFAVRALLGGHDHAVSALVYHPRQVLVSGGRRRGLHWRRRHRCYPLSCAHARSDANMLVSSGRDGIFVWDVAAGACITRIAEGMPGAHEGDVEVLTWVFDGTALLSGRRVPRARPRGHVCVCGARVCVCVCACVCVCVCMCE